MAFNRDAYENADASGQGLLRLEPGIYLCQIISYEDNEDKQYLKIKFDITDGAYKNYFANQAKQFGEYPRDGYEIRSYKETAMSFFKGFITSLEKSNPGFDFKRTNYDFKSIINRKFVGIFGEEEIPFPDDNGNPIVKVRLQKIASTERLAQGDLKVPERKTLSDDDREKLLKQINTEKIVAERQADKADKAAPKKETQEADKFYEISKQLASEEDLPF